MEGLADVRAGIVGADIFGEGLAENLFFFPRSRSGDEALVQKRHGLHL